RAVLRPRGHGADPRWARRPVEAAHAHAPSDAASRGDARADPVAPPSGRSPARRGRQRVLLELRDGVAAERPPQTAPGGPAPSVPARAPVHDRRSQPRARRREQPRRARLPQLHDLLDDAGQLLREPDALEAGSPLLASRARAALPLYRPGLRPL